MNTTPDNKPTKKNESVRGRIRSLEVGESAWFEIGPGRLPTSINSMIQGLKQNYAQKRSWSYGVEGNMVIVTREL